MEHRNYLSNTEKLKQILDRMYGFEKRTKSTVKKVSQSYNEIFNEHIFVIEYRVMMDKQKNEGVSDDIEGDTNLLQHINNLVD